MSKTLNDIFVGLTTVVIDIVVCALLMACFWTAVEAMRQFGVYSPQAMSEQLHAVKVAEDALRTYDPHGFLGQIESALKWYNLTFIGAARYGSGLGIFIGAYLALASLRSRVLPAKVVAACLAGAFVGARLFLMVTSEPKMFLAGACVGAVMLASLTIWQGGEQAPDLPTT